MRRSIILYDKRLKVLARGLRKEGTLAEIILWIKVRKKALSGYDFHRQKPIGKYIIDFYCSELKLAIEIDGASHNERIEKDYIRQKELESLGIRFLRFQEKDVRFNLEGVIEQIELWISEHSATEGKSCKQHTPSPLSGSHPSQEGT
ncbi:MAG: endonuclease domain-containing protein [Bacteroidota bacterium]